MVMTRYEIAEKNHFWSGSPRDIVSEIEETQIHHDTELLFAVSRVKTAVSALETAEAELMALLPSVFEIETE